MATLRERSKRPEKSALVRGIMREHHRVPIIFYAIKDFLIDVVTNRNFMDAALLAFAFIALAVAFPFYPVLFLAILLIALVLVALYHPFLGLIFYIVLIFPVIAYQMPDAAWVFTVVISASLIIGYMHYRPLILAFITIALAFSALGYIFEIPMLILIPLLVGYKRATVLAILFILGTVMFSALTGIQNFGYVAYNAPAAYNAVMTGGIDGFAQYTTVNTIAHPRLSIAGFPHGLSNDLGAFAGGGVIDNIPNEFGAMLGSLMINPLTYIFQLAAIIVVSFAIDYVAVSSRSKFKGSKASILGVGFPIAFLGISYVFRNASGFNALFSMFGYSIFVLMLVSFLIAPALIYILELYNINIVKALEVRKQDLRMKFGDAFEDLQSENIHASFDEIGDYEATKKELKEAIIAPIEDRGISQAYNVKPSKGILFFGPPGTGKTMMMRALANDIHAGFYVVKASNLISSYPGETEKLISSIFATARKHAPTVLFFDEIDAIARSRDAGEGDETRRQALSQLLIEMDGFQKANQVIIVGATNVPQVLDAALMRPGRFDKIIYMPLPDLNARKEIFKVYLKKLPVSSDVDIDELAEKTERYSGADIKALVENIAQRIAQEASSQKRVLAINHSDILHAIRATKPSTTLAQLDEYNKFRIDFERRSFSEPSVEKEEKVGLDSVVGLDDAKKAIVEAIQIPLMHPDLIKKYSIKPINGLLMFGPPGTGKTMLMNAVSGDMTSVTMLKLDGGELANQSTGDATGKIKDVFQRAEENLPSIVFIDEMDAIVPKRDQSSERTVQIVGSLLQELDGIRKRSGIVVIAATNRPESIDPAILRAGRFDKLIFVKPPDAVQRAELFEMYLKDCPVENIDYRKIGEMAKGFTGADIANVCREAKSGAMSANIKTGKEVKVSESSLEGAIKKVKPSATESVMGRYTSFLSGIGER